MATIEDRHASSSSSSSQQQQHHVIFQKVVRPCRDLPDLLFLGYLVEYLEDHFHLPPDLPMVYETTRVQSSSSSDDGGEVGDDDTAAAPVAVRRTTDKDDDGNHDGRGILLAWDSPLSPSVRDTRMEMEVVGIYTDKRKQDGNGGGEDVGSRPSVPNMAMVVVRKAGPDNNNNNNINNNNSRGTGTGGRPTMKPSVPPMMQGLFAASERKILHALDRALDDFMAGNLPAGMMSARDRRTEGGARAPPPLSSPLPNVRTAREAMEAEWLHDDDESRRPGRRTEKEVAAAAERARGVVLDAHATAVGDGVGDGPRSSKAAVGTDAPRAGTTKTATTPTKATMKRRSSTKEEIAAAKARAVETMNIKSEAFGRRTLGGTNPATDNAGTAKDFAVTTEAAKKKATVTTEAATKKAAAAAKVGGSTAAAAMSKGDAVVSDPSREEDFAVAAARRAVERRKAESDPPVSSEEDYAVAAARKMAASAAIRPRRKTKGLDEKLTSRNDEEEMSKQTSSAAAVVPDNSKTGTAQSLQIPADFKMEDHLGEARAFRMVISKPKGRAKGTPTTTTTKKESSSVATKMPSTEPEPTGVADVEQRTESNRKLNVKVVDERNELNSLLGPPTYTSLGMSDGESNKIPESNNIPPPQSPEDQEEINILKDAVDVMDEIASQGQDMSAEQLLRDILKFDDDKKKEEMPGTGFVNGAFEKAKELMRERYSARQAKAQMEIGFKEVERTASIKQNILDPSELQGAPASAELSPEEELKAMFAAGQRIADGRIAQRTSVGGMETKSQKRTSEEEVDDLISQEKSVSSYARVLDEELAELEVCINNSPGEEFDGPRQNPLFDVMSGPEVYNPNVELDSVNYPGALPGTKDVKLPKELVEAIKQAEFATNVLMSMKTVEVKDANGESKVQYFAGNRELSSEQVENLQEVVTEASRIGIIDNPIEIMAERSRMQLILDELWNQPEERFYEIASNYKDLLLSDRFVILVRERLRAIVDRDLDALRRNDESLKEAHEREREILGQLVVYAQALLKEARALGAELEAHQLEVVRSICKVAMNPAHTTEEETAMALSDAVRDMRPLLDDIFVAYLKYAVAEEEAKLARAGLLDDPDHNQWLYVLKIVQQGVYAEIAKGINRYIEHIWYVLRMETPRQRRLLLESLIDDMPTLDVRPFVQVVDNIVGSLGDGVKGEFDGVVPLGEMTNKLLQLHRDVQELLPPERVALKSRDADEWAARQKKRLLEQRKIGEQRLQAARETEHLAGEIDGSGSSGEIERIE